MIALLTDFGLQGPYIGQVKAVLHQCAAGIPVIDLFSDLPPFCPKSAAYLLPAYCRAPFPPGTVFLCVVDPGVGSERLPLILHADGYWFVGPDNGIFEIVMRRAESVQTWCITWRPDILSNSFHGRDLFAPIAARLAKREVPDLFARLCSHGELCQVDWPDDLAEVVYIDHFGNAVTGLQAKSVTERTAIICGPSKMERATTFSTVSAGTVFWYVNSNGLVELAANRARADTILGLWVGARLKIVSCD